MPTSRLVTAFAAAAALSGGCTPTSTPDPLMTAAAATEPRLAPGALTDASIVSTAATVVAIDQSARTLTLRLPDGRLHTVAVDASVRGFSRIHTGDEVVATYYQALAVELRKPGTAKPGATDDTDVVEAAGRQRPAGAVAETTTVTAEIVRIDQRHHSIDLRGPDGALTTVTVRHPDQLAGVSVGALVEVSLTQALAIQVEKAPKR